MKGERCVKIVNTGKKQVEVEVYVNTRNYPNHFSWLGARVKTVRVL